MLLLFKRISALQSYLVERDVKRAVGQSRLEQIPLIRRDLIGDRVKKAEKVVLLRANPLEQFPHN
jgi:hypothetical protein